jgi:putative redox protein
MTVALYARRKSWPLEAVTVRLRHSNIYAADCADRETKEGMVDHIESDLAFAGRLTQEQCSKLRAMAHIRRITQQRSCGRRSHVTLWNIAA